MAGYLAKIYGNQRKSRQHILTTPKSQNINFCYIINKKRLKTSLFKQTKSTPV